jgi:hypothetical protein
MTQSDPGGNYPHSPVNFNVLYQPHIALDGERIPFGPLIFGFGSGMERRTSASVRSILSS